MSYLFCRVQRSGRKVGDPATELGLARIMSRSFQILLQTMLTSLQMVALQKHLDRH